MAIGDSGSGFGGLPVGAKVGVLLLLLGLISIVYYTALHMSLAEEIQGAQSTMVQLQQEEQEALQQQREFEELTQQLAAREAIDQQNRRVLPEDTEIAAFLQDLNRVAELSGLDIRLVEPRPEEPLELYVRIPVALALSGKFHQVAKFFYNVSQLERAINMENVSLGTPTTDGDEVRLTVAVRATTFRRPSPAEAPAAAPAGGAQ